MATYGGGTTYTAYLTSTNCPVNSGETTIFQAAAADRYYLVKFLSQSMASGTGSNGQAAIRFYVDNGLGGYVEGGNLSFVEPAFPINPGVAVAIGAYTEGVGGCDSNGYFLMSPGMRVRCTPGAGAGGTIRIQMSIIEYVAS